MYKDLKKERKENMHKAVVKRKVHLIPFLSYHLNLGSFTFPIHRMQALDTQVLVLSPSITQTQQLRRNLVIHTSHVLDAYPIHHFLCINQGACALLRVVRPAFT